eukprot:gene10696-7429_t
MAPLSCSAAADRHAWICPECHKRFLSAATLQRHRATRHAVQQAEAQDALCLAVQQSNSALESHLNTLRLLAKTMRQIRTDEASLSVSSSTSAAVHTIEGENCRAAVPQPGPQTISALMVQQWQDRQKNDAPLKFLGTGLSHWIGIGVVRGKKKIGRFTGHLIQSSIEGKVQDGPLQKHPYVLEFVLETHGYMERAPGQMMMFRNHVPVRVVGKCPDSSHQTYSDGCGREEAPSYVMHVATQIVEGDLVEVHGQYGVHASFDVVSKKLIENVVVEADMVALIGSGSHRDVTDASPTGAQPDQESPPDAAPLAAAQSSSHRIAEDPLSLLDAVLKKHARKLTTKKKHKKLR